MGTLKGKCAIVGYGETRQHKHPDKVTRDLLAEAVVMAVEDAGLEKKDVDGFITMRELNTRLPNMSQETFNDYLLFSDQLRMLQEMCVGGATANCMAAHAAAAIESGMCRVVVCAGAGKFSKDIRGEIIMSSNFSWDFEAIYGPPVHTMNAIAANRHMFERGFTAEHLAKVVVYQRKWALMHPNSYTYGGRELTVKEVLNSRMISTPLTLYMCSIPCDGGAAFVVTSADVAKTLKHPPVYILGEGECHPYGHISSAPRITPTGAYLAAQRAYEVAGIIPKDVDIGYCYDAFASHVPAFMEDMGFGEGRIGEFIDEGHTDLGGDLPWNTHGGLLSGGQAAGTGHIRYLGECVIQLRGEAGQRQVKKHEIGIVHGFGGMMACNSVLILGR
ncbi:thiolase family protein [Chloroflexota bacterium]